MRTLLTRAALIIGLLGIPAVGQAADMPVKAPPAPLPPPWSWTGFYIGIHGGGAWGDLSVDPGGGSADISGGFVGGQLGFNYQTGNAVWGIEVDSAWASIGRTDTIAFGPTLVTGETDIDYLGSLRGRLGYAAPNQSLWYITGGLGWMHNNFDVTVALPPFAAGVSSSNTHIGWTLGGGYEWAFQPNWTLKVEYLYYNFDDETYFENVVPGGFPIDAEIHTVKVGLNYLFR